MTNAIDLCNQLEIPDISRQVKELLELRRERLEQLGQALAEKANALFAEELAGTGFTGKWIAEVSEDFTEDEYPLSLRWCVEGRDGFYFMPMRIELDDSLTGFTSRPEIEEESSFEGLLNTGLNRLRPAIEMLTRFKPAFHEKGVEVTDFGFQRISFRLSSPVLIAPKWLLSYGMISIPESGQPILSLGIADQGWKGPLWLDSEEAVFDCIANLLANPSKMHNQMSLQEFLDQGGQLIPVMTSPFAYSQFAIGFFANGRPHVIFSDRYRSEDDCQSAIDRLMSSYIPGSLGNE